ncbi:AbrB family transcriptional regulator [Proteiniclasticum sp. QWL-01]|uniref:AbrB family transcriptional regulator n=1 Tax=Proteiniclasticum sp. QWL-01 TaxID=3036945 RepID=UPI00240FAE13|nr:AbrB family transcriptional regulator [Proteiniclasticum sp. QWL-01]WFF72587.1 AbrB family transcriptional regulator [Proteiniclasticum sp. QWL-01]
MTDLLLTFLLGLVGGLLFLNWKVPAGAMVGAMLFVAVFSILTGRAEMPADVRVLTQLVAGAYIGSSIQYKDVLALRRILLPALLMISLMISLDIAMGFLLYRLTSLDLATALMACAPGGLMDISLISADVGANSSSVAVLQLLRLVTVLAFFPLLMKKVSERIQTPGQTAAAPVEEPLVISVSERAVIRNQWYLSRQKRKNLAITLLIAGLSGSLGKYLGIPAGALTLSMVCVALLNVLTGRGYLPAALRRFTQMLAGILIGASMDASDLALLKGVMVPALVLIVGIIVINLTVGLLLNRLSDLDLMTSLLASVPGGVSDMALIARDLGGDQSKVAILQLFRYLFVVALYPVLIRQLLTWFV